MSHKNRSVYTLKNVITITNLGRDPVSGLSSKGKTTAPAMKSETKRYRKFFPNARPILESSSIVHTFDSLYHNNFS
jgi:hypothetical protein